MSQVSHAPPPRGARTRGAGANRMSVIRYPGGDRDGPA